MFIRKNNLRLQLGELFSSIYPQQISQLTQITIKIWVLKNHYKTPYRARIFAAACLAVIFPTT